MSEREQTPLEELEEIITENEADDPMFYADPDYKPIPAAEFTSVPFGHFPLPSYTSVPLLSTYYPEGIYSTGTGYIGTMHYGLTGTQQVIVVKDPNGYYTVNPPNFGQQYSRQSSKK